MNHSSLLEKNLRFARFLRDHGFKIFFSNIIDSIRCLETIDLSSKDDFRAVLRANLVTNDMEYRLFDNLFKIFWDNQGAISKDDPEESLPEKQFPEMKKDRELNHNIPLDGDIVGNKKGVKETIEMVTYSPVSIIEKKDIDRFRSEDIQVAKIIVKNMLSSFQTTRTRRIKKSKKPGSIDFPGTIRQSLKYGGIPADLCFRRKRKRLKRLVIIADVSGSMNKYSSFLIPFLLGLRSVGSKAEVFVFSTSLTSVTNIIRKYTIDKALEKISDSVLDWSGGTRIGYSLGQFNQQNSGRLLNKRSVILIISDGWDLGAKAMLKKEMETIQRNSYSTIWLNPLAGEEGYRPVCKGMQIALENIDHFFPANNLQNLRKAGKSINRILSPQ